MLCESFVEAARRIRGLTNKNMYKVAAFFFFFFFNFFFLGGGKEREYCEFFFFFEVLVCVHLVYRRKIFYFFYFFIFLFFSFFAFFSFFLIFLIFAFFLLLGFFSFRFGVGSDGRSQKKYPRSLANLEFSTIKNDIQKKKHRNTQTMAILSNTSFCKLPYCSLSKHPYTKCHWFLFSPSAFAKH